MEPQIKAKLQLEKGWQPYGLLGYVANMNDKAKIVVDEMTFEFDKIKGYVEYGVGVNKDFINKKKLSPEFLYFSIKIDNKV